MLSLLIDNSIDFNIRSGFLLDLEIRLSIFELIIGFMSNFFKTLPTIFSQSPYLGEVSKLQIPSLSALKRNSLLFTNILELE